MSSPMQTPPNNSDGSPPPPRSNFALNAFCFVVGLIYGYNSANRPANRQQ